MSDLVSAREARVHRKAMRKPFRRRRGQNDLYDIVRLHLRRLSRRVLNDRCRLGVEPPHRDLLMLALERYLQQQRWHLVYHHDYGEQREPQRLRRTYLDESRSGQGAEAQGRVGGRPSKVDAKKLATIKKLIASGDHSRADIARLTVISRATLYRVIATL